MYRKNKRANCRAEFKIKPKKDDLTYKRKINGKTRYFFTGEIFETKAADDIFKIVVIFPISYAIEILELSCRFDHLI